MSGFIANVYYAANITLFFRYRVPIAIFLAYELFYARKRKPETVPIPIARFRRFLSSRPKTPTIRTSWLFSCFRDPSLAQPTHDTSLIATNQRAIPMIKIRNNFARNDSALFLVALTIERS